MGGARTADVDSDAAAPQGGARAGNVSHIGNKHKRQDLYQKYRKEKAKRKLQKRLKQAKAERASSDGKALKKVRIHYADR